MGPDNSINPAVEKWGADMSVVLIATMAVVFVCVSSAMIAAYRVGWLLGYHAGYDEARTDFKGGR